VWVCLCLFACETAGPRVVPTMRVWAGCLCTSRGGTYISTYICWHIYIYVCFYEYIYMYIYTYICVYIYICMFVNVCAYVYMYTCT